VRRLHSADSSTDRQTFYVARDKGVFITTFEIGHPAAPDRLHVEDRNAVTAQDRKQEGAAFDLE